MNDFKPYADESAVLKLGNLAIENRVDRISLSGDAELTKDKAGLALARHLAPLRCLPVNSRSSARQRSSDISAVFITSRIAMQGPATAARPPPLAGAPGR